MTIKTLQKKDKRAEGTSRNDGISLKNSICVHSINGIFHIGIPCFEVTQAAAAAETR